MALGCSFYFCWCTVLINITCLQLCVCYWLHWRLVIGCLWCLVTCTSRLSCTPMLCSFAIIVSLHAACFLSADLDGNRHLVLVMEPVPPPLLPLPANAPTKRSTRVLKNYTFPQSQRSFKQQGEVDDGRQQLQRRPAVIRRVSRATSREQPSGTSLYFHTNFFNSDLPEKGILCFLVQWNAQVCLVLTYSVDFYLPLLHIPLPPLPIPTNPHVVLDPTNVSFAGP